MAASVGLIPRTSHRARSKCASAAPAVTTSLDRTTMRLSSRTTFSNHPRCQARSEARAQAPRGHGPDPPSQHPRAALLPLGDANLLKHPTLDQLHTLGLHGMAKAFADLADAGQAKDIAHADWLALLLDRETSWRRDKRLTARLRAAKLRQQASVEDVDYRAARGLDRALFLKLAEGEWIDATTIWPWSAH